jgi:hypothetical protein
MSFGIRAITEIKNPKNVIFRYAVNETGWI